MKRFHILILLIILFLHFSCKDKSSTSFPEIPFPVPFTEVLMQCADLVSMGDQLEVVIRSQAEFDSLIEARFQKPLDLYWNEHYASVLNLVKQRYPGLSDSAYARLVRQVFYSFLPFKGTDSCNHPSINFNEFILLGLSAHGGGCRIPDYEIDVFQDDLNKEMIYKIKIIQFGYCSMAILKNKWVVVPKVPGTYRIIFQKEYTRVKTN